MDENVLSRLDVELAHAGEATALSPKMLLLEKLRITPEKELEPMEFLFRLFGKPCFPRRELVAVTGKAKSGKTFVTSMLMACCNMRDVLSFHREHEPPLRVLWYDTEQSDESTQDILKNRVFRMVAPAPDLFSQRSGELFDVFNVRAVEWKERRSLLKEAVERYGPDLVIVDGIRDLVNDINDGVLAQEVMEELLHLATRQNCCIVCVLHQNKGSEDHNLRGWIGTELMNKAFEVYACEKMMPQRVFKLEQTLTRKYDIEQTMYFEVDEQGLPCSSVGPTDGMATTKTERLPSINSEYIVHEDDGSWRFDVTRLFHAAFQGADELQGGVLRERVMQLSGIVIPFKYNQLLHQALDEKIIEKTQRDGLTVYRPAPF
ncbi:MAG: AAA family ATPase [Bacteroidaceae bacterium]|nr:AAA family ATPase [Bacteroidaceae bacterium]